MAGENDTDRSLDGHDDAHDTKGPTSLTALRDLLDVVELEDHSPIVQLFVGGLALALDSEERGSK